MTNLSVSCLGSSPGCSGAEAAVLAGKRSQQRTSGPGYTDRFQQQQRRRGKESRQGFAHGALETSGFATGVFLAALASRKWMNRNEEDKRTSVVHCCGIVGYAGPKDANKILSEGITLLQNRGYDSCGIATVDAKGQLVTTKFASRGSTSDCVDLLKKHAVARHEGHHCGIAHTRWATHGSKSDCNAHPHSDWKNRISLVHNGTIDNFSQLKRDLVAKGIPFVSETDSEVIANMVGDELDQGFSFEESVQRAVSQLKGTWGLCLAHKDKPDTFMLARNGSPLLVGGNGSEVFVASEPLAIANYTNEYISLNDGDVVRVTTNGIDHLVDGRSVREIHQQTIELSPKPYKHWTIKEIFEQPTTLSRAINHGARISDNHKVTLGGLDDNKSKMLAIKRLLITGCGTSLYAGLYGELLMKYLECFETINVVDASEVDAHAFPKPYESTGLLAMSQSGETRDTVVACQQADDLMVTKFSIVNVVGSLLARMTGCGVYLNAGREVGVASTKAFTSQVTVLTLVACWFAQNRGEGASDRVKALSKAMHYLPLYANQCLKANDQCREIAQRIKNARSIFVLGKGFGFPVALEGALKIKEISYIHAEGFGGGQLKHGPFALLDEKEKTPVILICLNDREKTNMLNAAQQVKARGAELIIITDVVGDRGLVEVADHVITIPSNGPLTALLATMPLQLLAYHLATLKGFDPDMPRGLAKTVTVS